MAIRVQAAHPYRDRMSPLARPSLRSGRPRYPGVFESFTGVEIAYTLKLGGSINSLTVAAIISRWGLSR